MKNQLPRFLLILSICFSTIACSIDDDFDYLIEEQSTENFDGSSQEFEPEIKLSHCFNYGVMCEIDNPNDEAYGYNWSHDDMALGHDSKTPCICGGTIQVKVTRLADGLSHTTSLALPDCNEEVE